MYEHISKQQNVFDIFYNINHLRAILPTHNAKAAMVFTTAAH
jgi:hypothetical protein